MKTKTIVVNLRPIDPDKLEIMKVSGTKETFKFNLLLETVPDCLWLNCTASSGNCKPLLYAASCDTPFSGLLAHRFETSDPPSINPQRLFSGLLDTELLLLQLRF